MVSSIKTYLVAWLMVVGVFATGCSREAEGPSWTCEPLALEADDREEVSGEGGCDIRVQGNDMVVRLQRKEKNWNLLVSHLEGGQVRAKLEYAPKRREPVALEATNRTGTCGRRHCVFPIPDDDFSAFEKSGVFTVTLTRAKVVPHSIKHQKFTEQFTTRGLRKVIKSAGH